MFNFLNTLELTYNLLEQYLMIITVALLIKQQKFQINIQSNGFNRTLKIF